MRKDSKLYRSCATLSAAQLEVRITLLAGTAALLDGRFAVRPCKEGWEVFWVMNHREEKWHTVLVDLSACSCPDNKYRNHECKHLKALKRWLAPEAQS